MKILFAPSEAKKIGGIYKDMEFCFDLEREKILQTYDSVVKSGDTTILEHLYGTKERYDIDIFNSPTIEAVRRYSGVAYEYLDFDSLHPLHQEFVYDHLVIFSNLFGPLCAHDKIPFYKLKQGSSVDTIKPDRYYKERCKHLLKDEEILDLRAGYYEKFYKPPFCVKMKFIKNGKVVSHWAKAYRGKVLREIAQNEIDSFKKLQKHQFQGLLLREIQSKKGEEIWIFEITD